MSYIKMLFDVFLTVLPPQYVSGALTAASFQWK